MKIFLKVIVILIAVILIVAACAYAFATAGMKTVLGEAISPADLSALSDGSYQGTYKNARWSNTVEVTIVANKIVDVKILDDVAIAQEDVTKELIQKVIQKQNIDVDTISGATATCNAYLKAMEDALK